jgi:hypothetical protein
MSQEKIDTKGLEPDKIKCQMESKGESWYLVTFKEKNNYETWLKENQIGDKFRQLLA